MRALRTIVLGGVVLAASGTARAADAVEAALSARRDESSAKRAVEVCGREHALAPDRMDILAALVRARYHLACVYRTEDEDIEELERAIEAGLKGLAHRMNKDLDDVAALDDARDGVPKDAVGALFWTTVAYGRTITNMSVFSQPGAARRFERLVQRALVLDERYFHAGPHRVLAEYQQNAPGFLGGDAEGAKTHARKALELFPDFAENHIVHAKVVHDSDEPSRRKALERAIELGSGAAGIDAAEQRAAQQRARALLDGTAEE